jgi:hypothetical protein
MATALCFQPTEGGIGDEIISDMVRLDNKRTKEHVNAETDVQLSRLVIGLRLDEGSNDGGKKIKGIEITTTSEEEVLQNPENPGKVVSKSNRRIELTETSIPEGKPVSDKTSPTIDPGGSKPRMEQPCTNESINYNKIQIMNSNNQIEQPMFPLQTSCSEVFDNNRCCSPGMGSDFLSIRDSKKYISQTQSSSYQPPNTTITFQNSSFYFGDNFRKVETAGTGYDESSICF